MKEFMMLFRHVPDTSYQPSPEDMQAEIKKWNDWIGGIAAQGKFIKSDALGYEGRTITKTEVLTDGPYAEVKEIVGGYIIVKAENLEDALQLAQGCPTLEMGGNVEVRDIMVFDVQKFNYLPHKNTLVDSHKEHISSKTKPFLMCL